MLIGYSTFLINIYLGILVFQLGVFVNVKTYIPIDTFYVLLLLCTLMLLKIDFVFSDHIK